MKDLFKEAIADAKKVKEVAVQNAKLALEEAFQPTLQRMVSARLAEEDEEEDPEAAPVAPVEDVPVDPAPVADAPVDDAPPVDPAPEDEDDPELEALIRELEGATGEEDDPFADEPLEEDDDNWDNSAPSDSDLEIEALLREMEDDDCNEDPLEEGNEEEYLDRPDDIGSDLSNPRNENRRRSRFGSRGRSNPLQTENNKLKGNLKEAVKAIRILKAALNEVDLLNAKLMYSGRLIRESEMSQPTQMKVLKQFDLAKSTREVQLVYTSLKESLKKTQVRSKLVEGASKPAIAIKPKSKLQEGFVPRWQLLAGITKPK